MERTCHQQVRQRCTEFEHFNSDSSMYVEDIERMMAKIADVHNGVDILVNNAGIQHVRC